MKNLLTPVLAAAFATALSVAAPADDAAAAARKLVEASNYSWAATTEIANSQFPAMPVEGVTEKGGYTVVSRTFNGNTMKTVRKGDLFVMQNQEGSWITREEMMQQFANRGGGRAGAARGGGRGGFGFGGGQSNPAEEIARLIELAKNLRNIDGAISGELSEEAVAQRLTFGGRGGPGGQTPPAPKNVSGTVKIWVKAGAITKFQLHIKGTVAGRDGETEREITTTTEIKNVGSTKVEVPAEAKTKLGA